MIIFCLVVFNFILVASDNKLRHREIPHRVRILIEQLDGEFSFFSIFFSEITIEIN